MATNADLLGFGPGVVPAGTMGTVNDAVARAIANPENDEKLEKERELVRKLAKEYKIARDFDKEVRKGYARDRSYANGTAQAEYASTANLIASFIHVLEAFIYARDPDVSARPAKKVAPPPLPVTLPPAIPAVPAAVPGPLAPAAPPGIPGTPVGEPQSQSQQDATAFAETLELVIRRLWKDARLKRTGRKMVRSGFTIGVGWFKAVMFSEHKENPEVAARLRDMQQQLKRIQKLESDLAQSNPDPGFDPVVKRQELELAIQGAQANLMKLVRAGMHVDFVRGENIQVSTDVADTEDYLEAGWIADEIFIPVDDITERFPRLKDYSDELKKATLYHQRKPRNQEVCDPMEPLDRSDEGQFVAAGNAGGQQVMGGDKPLQFAKVIEVWDKRDGMVKTMVEGVEMWAREPYPPPHATTRFYPYFRLAFFEVDGERHPQSLAYKLYKLQDEYSATRSSGRLTRERSIPGNIFNADMVAPEDMRKVTESVHMENIPVKLTNQEVPLQNVIAPKPIPKVDPNLYDTTPIQRDMEVISGVQEALQATVQVEKTAREAAIQNSGFAARTNANRDNLEEVFTDFAQYTAECAIQEIPPEFAQRIAGPAAFWPYGMDVQDLLTLVEVDVKAGSTGRPNAEAERAAWATILPLLEKLMLNIRPIQATDPELANAMVNLLRETLRRMDDRLDVDRFIPAGAPPPTAALTPPVSPGAPNPGQGAAMPLPSESADPTQQFI